MKQQVQHIDIPFDELRIFQNTHEQKYQDILMETLLLSTLGTIHDSKKNYKSNIYVTLKSFWIVKKQKIKAIIPIKAIVAVVKSYKHPEIVLITREDVSNVRITTSSEQRSWYIISALSYDFTYALNKKLPLISIKQDSLDYFQRTVEDKQKNRNINIDIYPKHQVAYQKPFKDISNIYGHLSQKSKIILERQLQMLSSEYNNSHLVYLARIKDERQNFRKQQTSLLEVEDRYICHYIEKKHPYLQRIYEHQNADFITELMFAKATEFKIQLFFQFSKSLRGIKMNHLIFKKIWNLYDKCKQIDRNFVISTDALQLVQRTGILGQKIRRGEEMAENEQKLRWVNGQNQIVVRQFRYEFLNQVVGWDRFLYEQFDQQNQQVLKQQQSQSQKISNGHQKQKGEQRYQQKCKQKKQQSQQAQLQGNIKKKFKKKVYTIGLILYQLSTGRHLFSYTPAFINQIQVVEQQIELLIQFKKMMKTQKIRLFPKFLDLGVDQLLQNFITKCIYGQFQNQQQLLMHPWALGETKTTKL